MRRWLDVCGRFAALVSAFMLAPATPASAHPTGISKRYHVQLHPDGQPPLFVHVEEMGSGPVLLLLHDLGGSSYAWRLVAPDALGSEIARFLGR